MRKNRKIKEWIVQESGKHFCQCGCNRLIEITANHAHNGIPKYLVGHSGRRHVPKMGFFSEDELAEWIESQKDKHLCQCGCGGYIQIKKAHQRLGIPRFLVGHVGRTLNYPSDVDRFWPNVDRKGEDDCWLWTAGADSKGYGTISSKRKAAKSRAHRLSYIIHFGDFDADMHVLHRCDTPRCVNPKHLFLGNHEDNMHDAAMKGRFNSKITAEEAREIVRMIRSGVRPYLVARKFGLAQSTICGIMTGRTWSHATGIARLE